MHIARDENAVPNLLNEFRVEEEFFNAQLMQASLPVAAQAPAQDN